MDHSEHHEAFVCQLTENQNRLYAYVYSLVADHNSAADVLQETNVVLWRKIDEFRSESPFLPWAFAIARFQVLAHLRDRKRDRVLLDENLAEKISDEAEQSFDLFDVSREALGHCLETLAPSSEELVRLRYMKHLTIQQVADSMGRTISATKVNLMRIRRTLADCIEKRLASEA